MKLHVHILLFIVLPFFAAGQKKTVYGDLKATDSTELNIIKTVPDSFPTVSVIFEAIKNNQPVSGLNGDLIRVTENNKPCRILRIKEIENNYPINISLIVDHSGSMLEDPGQHTQLLVMVSLQLQSVPELFYSITEEERRKNNPRPVC